jgi:hypothetical protein
MKSEQFMNLQVHRSDADAWDWARRSRSSVQVFSFLARSHQAAEAVRACGFV